MSQVRAGVGNSGLVANAPARTTAGDTSTNLVAPQLDLGQGWHVFAMGNYQNIDISDTANAAGGKDNSYDVTFGVDARVCDNLVLGLAFNGFRADVDLNDGGEADVDGGKGSLFATWFQDDFHLDAAIGGGFNSYDNIKRASLGGVTQYGVPVVGMAEGDTTGQEFDGLLSGGYDIKMDQFTLTPNAGLYYTALSIDGYTEHGSLAPLKIDRLNANSLQSSLGATLAYNTQIGDVPVRPELGVAWRHEFLDDTYSIDSRLASGAGTSFSVDSTELGRDSVPVWLGVNVQATKNVGLHVVGEGTFFRENDKEYSVMIGLDWAL